ncbi:hypothetical protein [Bacillus sp. FSL K6-3431]|uniref:hypothetical protein n=1 Tax=Bacillus sp. FSL K6-3431 TaxID=2921500 RepID=UPI0030F5D451
MSGLASRFPREVLGNLICSDQGIETDEKTAMYLLNLIVMDHEQFLSPHLMAVDKILSEAISSHFNDIKIPLPVWRC